MNTVLRKEEKYGMLTQEALKFSKKVEQILDSDGFSKDGSYMVRSLYFDTIDDKDFFDKINEQQLRRKIRLRIYSPNQKTAKLEVKQKQGAYQKKRSLSISKEDAEQLIAGNNSVLLHYNSDFANEVYAIMSMECYQPKAIIEYQRRAFMAKENQIRLTFDQNICASESNLNLFDENLILNSVLDPNHVVFEVKYNHFMLSYIAELIDGVDRRLVSSSKYCLGRSIGYPLYL